MRGRCYLAKLTLASLSSYLDIKWSKNPRFTNNIKHVAHVGHVRLVKSIAVWRFHVVFTFRVGYSWTLRAMDSCDAVSCTAILVLWFFLWLFVFCFFFSLSAAASVLTTAPWCHGVSTDRVGLCLRCCSHLKWLQSETFKVKYSMLFTCMLSYFFWPLQGPFLLCTQVQNTHMHKQGLYTCINVCSDVRVRGLPLRMVGQLVKGSALCSRAPG